MLDYDKKDIKKLTALTTTLLFQVIFSAVPAWYPPPFSCHVGCHDATSGPLSPRGRRVRSSSDGCTGASLPTLLASTLFPGRGDRDQVRGDRTLTGG